MFRRLLEAHSRSVARQAWLDGVGISVVAHLVIVGGAFVATRPIVYRTTDEVVPQLQMAEFLVPKEKLAGSRPQREQISWLTLETKAGSGFSLEPVAKKDDEKLKLEVPKGEAADEEKGEAAPPPQPPIELGDSIKTVLEVDTAVMRYDDSAAPSYPETMLKKRIEGMVVVQYVVDTTGHADTTSFRVLQATHMDFAKSVRNTLPRMRFHPAKMGTRAVAQLVEQPFVFKIVDTVNVARPVAKKP